MQGNLELGKDQAQKELCCFDEAKKSKIVLVEEWSRTGLCKRVGWRGSG